jgi:hypothetical protein
MIRPLSIVNVFWDFHFFFWFEKNVKKYFCNFKSVLCFEMFDNIFVHKFVKYDIFFFWILIKKFVLRKKLKQAWDLFG